MKFDHSPVDGKKLLMIKESLTNGFKRLIGEEISALEFMIQTIHIKL